MIQPTHCNLGGGLYVNFFGVTRSHEDRCALHRSNFSVKRISPFPPPGRIARWQLRRLLRRRPLPTTAGTVSVHHRCVEKREKGARAAGIGHFPLHSVLLRLYHPNRRREGEGQIISHWSVVVHRFIRRLAKWYSIAWVGFLSRSLLFAVYHWLRTTASRPREIKATR